MNFKNNKGFTIVELLIVIIVIGILAAIAIVAYNGVTQKSRDTENKSNARQVINAVAAYNSEKGEWPANAGAAKTALTDFKTVNVPKDLIDNITSEQPAAAKAKNIQYEVCTGGGAKVSYWVGSESKKETLSAGNCTSS